MDVKKIVAIKINHELVKIVSNRLKPENLDEVLKQKNSGQKTLT
jgi:ribosomal protein L12E/L44/L45/RPP1/RPP2